MALLLILVVGGALTSGVVITGGAALAVVPQSRDAPTLSHASGLGPTGLGAGRFPVLIGAPQAVTNPTTLYTQEPAPMGVGDFGVTPSLTAYSYETTELMGNFTWNSQSISNTSLGSAAEDLYSVQLNVFLVFVDSGKTYTWWIQDVATMNTKTLLLQMMDCVWNATTASATVPKTGTLTGNGSVSGGVYSDDSTTAQGGSITTLAASSFALVIVSKEDASGHPEVLLEYVDSGTAGKVVAFDTVDFTFAKSVTSDSNFVVNGNALDVWGTAYDAEIMVGGPYNGDFTVAHNPTNLNMQLYRFNGHNFEAPPDAWNFGSETAESISSLSTTLVNDGYGIPSDALYNGTAHDATTGALYSSSQVGVLSIDDPTLASGTVAVGAGDTPFVGNTAWITLMPGTYHVWINGSGSTDLGMCTITAGGNLSVTLPSTCTGGSIGPSVTSFTVSPNPVTLGTGVNFTSTVTGGNGSLTYAYTGLPTGCTSTNAPTLACTPTVTGSFPVDLTVTDAHGNSGTGSVTLVVNSAGPTPLTVSSLTGTPNPVIVSNPTTLTTLASGGAGPLTYSYTGLPTPCTSSNASTIRCTPSTVGNYSITVNVHDSEKTPLTGSATLLLEVNNTPTPPFKIVSFVAWPNPVTVGETTHLYTNTSGGDGWTVFNYSGLPPGCITMINATLPCTPTTPGTYIVKVAAWPTATEWAFANLTLVVDLPPAPTLSGFVADPDPITLGESTTLSLTATGTGLTYAYAGLPAGCTNASRSSLACTPTVLGSFSITVTVRDAFGRTLSSDATLTVTAPALTGVSLVVDPSTLTVGGAATFTASASGGIAPFTYAYSDLPAGCTSPGNVSTFTCAPTAPGWYNVTLTVTDPASQSSTANGELHVEATTTTGGFSSLLQGTDLLLLVAGVLVLVVVVAAAVALRRKGSQPPPEEPWQGAPPESYTYAEGPGYPPQTGP